MVDHGRELFPGQLQCEQLVEQAVGSRDYTTSSNTTHLQWMRERNRKDRIMVMPLESYETKGLKVH